MILALALACSGEKEGDDVLRGVAGTVTAERVGETTTTVSGDAYTSAAFGVNANGRIALLLTPNPDATCADAANYLTNPDFDGEVVTPVGTCSIYVRASYDGGPLEVIDDAAAATVSLNCAMGDGEWVYEERDEGDVGYYFDGAWWIGSPDGFTLNVAGGDGSDFALALEMSSYNGSFTHDVAYPDPDPAAGKVTGETDVSWCADMGPALAR